MYAVKIGNFYVKNVEYIKDGGFIYINEIILSKEAIRSFKKERAESLAKEINGEIIKVGEELWNG